MAWTLLDQTIVGLPRSNLVKKPAAPVAASPADVPSSRPANPFEIATTFPQLPPFELAAAATAPSPTLPKSVDVLVDDTFDESLPAARPALARPKTPAAVDDPTSAELLERAARLGPPRMTWSSIVLPDDPILGEKMQPRVAERRARFRNVVKATLGACVALCVAAVAASAIAGVGDDAKTTTSSSNASLGRTAPASAVVSVERLDDAKRGKTPSTRTAAANATFKAVPAMMKSKRR